MRINPFPDTLSFFMQGTWPIYVLWVWLLGSLGMPLSHLVRTPTQRTIRHVWLWMARLLIGGDYPPDSALVRTVRIWTEMTRGVDLVPAP